MQVCVDSPCPVCSRMLKTGSLGAALLMSSRIWSTLGGSGRLGRTTRFLFLEPIFILQQTELRPVHRNRKRILTTVKIKARRQQLNTELLNTKVSDFKLKTVNSSGLRSIFNHLHVNTEGDHF